MNSLGGKELKSSPFREQTSQGREQEVWDRETAGRGGKGDYDEIILNIKILHNNHMKLWCQLYTLQSQKKTKREGAQNEILEIKFFNLKYFFSGK